LLLGRDMCGIAGIGRVVGARKPSDRFLEAN
jgi:hypothetical protein